MQVLPLDDDNKKEILRKQEFDEENPKDDNYKMSTREPKELEVLNVEDKGPEMHPIEHIIDLFCWENKQ
jgi:hypothetical protein